MAANFDLHGFLNDPQVQADKAGAVKFLQSKGILDAQGNAIPGTFKQPIQATQPVTTTAGTTYQPGSSFIDNIKALPGQLAGAGKALFDAVTGSEQGVGQDISSALTANSKIKDASKLAGNEQTYLRTVISLRDKAKAAGESTSHWDNIINNYKPQGYQAPDLPTTGKVLGDVAGTALDTFGFGSYGKAIQGAKELKTSGTLANDLSKSGKLIKETPTVVSGAKTGIKSATKLAQGVPQLTKKVLLGKEGLSTLAKIANPEAKAFVPIEQGGLGKKFEDVIVSPTKAAIDSFVANSKSTLKAVKESIPTDVKIDASKIGSAVNDGILKSVQNTADYHGVQGEASSIFKTPDALIHSGLFTPEEVNRVKGIVDVVKNWTDNSARGVLNLKEQLAPFYKEGLNASNSVLRGVQNNLKNIVSDVVPGIKPALKTASDNIDKADEFARHLLGTNESTGESKLVQVARNLSNPALKGYQHSLLEELQNATGHNIMPKLKGYVDYLDLLKKDFPSRGGTIAKTVGTRTGITGGIGAGILEGKKLLGF